MDRSKWTRKLRHKKLLARANYALVQWTNPRNNRAVFHVLPINDLKEHVEEESCWCAPAVEGKRGRSRSAKLIIHNALDCRELIEEHGVN